MKLILTVAGAAATACFLPVLAVAGAIVNLFPNLQSKCISTCQENSSTYIDSFMSVPIQLDADLLHPQAFFQCACRGRLSELTWVLISLDEDVITMCKSALGAAEFNGQFYLMEPAPFKPRFYCNHDSVRVPRRKEMHAGAAGGGTETTQTELPLPNNVKLHVPGKEEELLGPALSVHIQHKSKSDNSQKLKADSAWPSVPAQGAGGASSSAVPKAGCGLAADDEGYVLESAKPTSKSNAPSQ